MSNQIQLRAQRRAERGKGAAGRLRKEGRVPGIMYGYQVEPTAVSVDALELYHALHTDAGANVLIQLQVDDESYLTVTRELQRHPVRQETTHVDFVAVDADSPIAVEVPVHLVGEDDVASGAVVSQILYTAPMRVKPLDVPNFFELSIAGLDVGDVKRLEDLVDQLPEGAEFTDDLDRTVVTINAPVSEEELEALEEAAGVEQEEPELVGEEAEAPEEGEPADEEQTEEA